MPFTPNDVYEIWGQAGPAEALRFWLAHTCDTLAVAEAHQAEYAASQLWHRQITDGAVTYTQIN